ncbi:hypothetical protein M408DRAFT_68928 [Serendipita vermifera MAFF 305830]|uniref:Uncharacterized protein n=1 Tax=Serendipita vermifera MAFF 305830 TaxID=933852 RepID=A0A0C3BBK6_SERVB|nr:hypothetical protein M408DRAFT_68928 [Serendipita vermifera MAFF 305830]
MATPRNSTSSPNTISQRAVSAQAALLKAIKSTKPEEIESAVSKWEPLAKNIPQAHPDYEPVLASYAVALLLRWEHSHDVRDVRKAIITLENALTKLSTDPTPNRYQNLANLGAAYMDRYETLQKDPKDLMRAAECWEQAHDIARALGLMKDSANKLLTNLAEALFYAYEVGVAGVEAVDRAIKHLVVVHAHCREEKRATTRYKIGQCYSALYIRLKNREDLDAAIENFRASVEGEQLDREERQSALMELSRTLAKKYDASRERIDLEEAIKFARMTVQENQGEPWILRNLANLLYWMFKDLKDAQALDEAIEYYELVWALYQAKPGRSMATFYYSFGTALIRRYDAATDGKQTGRVQDIERAVDLLQLAVNNATPECLEDYRHRLKGAITRREKAANNPQTQSPPATMRSSNTIGFPSSPSSPVAVSFAEQQFDLPKRSSTLRRAPIPSLSSQPEALPTIPFTTDRRSRVDSQSTVRSSKAPSESTITPMRRGQTAPSLLSESMSIMTVPAVQNLPSMDQQRPRVLRRAGRSASIPVVPLDKPSIATKMLPTTPEKPRRDFLSFARLRSKAT